MVGFGEEGFLVLRESEQEAAADVVRRVAERSRWLVEVIDDLNALFAPLIEQMTAAVADPQHHDPPSDGLGYDERQRRAAILRARAKERACAVSDEERRAALIYLLATPEPHWHQLCWSQPDTILAAGGWTVDELRVMLGELLRWELVAQMVPFVEVSLAAAEGLGEADQRALAPLLHRVAAGVGDGEMGIDTRRRLLARITAMLCVLDPVRLPPGLLLPRDNWARPLLDLIGERPGPDVVRLITHLAALTGPRPSKKWRSQCLELLRSETAATIVRAGLCELARCPPTVVHATVAVPGGASYQCVVCEQNGGLARGFVWAAALLGGQGVVADLTEVALRTGGARRGLEPELKIAGAAINALGERAEPAALEALWRLHGSIRNRTLRKQLDTALATAAERRGITETELVERSVPGHGLGGDGTLSRALGDHTATIAIEDARTVRLVFRAPDGRTPRGVPAPLKAGFGAEIAELKARLKQVRATLSAEHARLEGLFTARRTLPYAQWARYYRDHPVTGALARRLVWELADRDDRWVSVLPAGEGFTGADGASVPAPGDDTAVRLWHPARADATETGRWRSVIDDLRLRQPFKQAFREVYPLTPAEEQAETYSNRFAGHIVDYSRLYALFKERGWQANVLGPYDGGYHGEATIELMDGAWRAVFFHDPADPDVGPHVDLAATDQVHFERRDGRTWQQARLREVPPLAISEAMRDVDLFVSVTSIGADPEWADRGEDRYAAYWRAFAFGELTPSAQVRRQALERLIPKLRIADRCALTERHLAVRGSLRTYKIHIGSANVLMEPGAVYLCIVAGRRNGREEVFLPFEEDGRLSLILSKAFLLADDHKITDETITRQIANGS
jgi:hypothetical protein